MSNSVLVGRGGESRLPINKRRGEGYSCLVCGGKERGGEDTEQGDSVTMTVDVNAL